MAALGTQSTKSAFVVRAGDDHRGGSLHVVGSEISVKISSNDTDGSYTVFEGVTPPLNGPPLHCHHTQDEWWYILDGHFRFFVDGNIFTAKTGDTVYAPKGSTHTFQNIGATPGITLTTVIPGGLDVFFEELSAAVPAGIEPDPAVVGPIFEKHDMEMVGPPLAVSHPAR